MKTFQLPTKDSTQALVKSYTFDLSHVDTVWCVLFTPRGWMKTRPRIIQTYRLLFCTCFTNATQITEAPERPEAPALLPVLLMTLMFCNAQRWIGIHGFVLGYLPYWFPCDSCLCCQSVLLSRLEVKSCFQHFISECLLKPVFTAQWSALLRPLSRLRWTSTR